MAPRPPMVEVVLAQHAEEAAFQWLLRNEAIHAPHFSLADLAQLDDRVSAHLDGLQVAGEMGWEFCCQELKWQEPGELFTAAVLALESDSAARLAMVTDVATESTAAAPGLASALAWLPYKKAQPHITALLQSEVPSLQRHGLAAAAMHRVDPGPVLQAAIDGDDPTVLPRALRAAGELGRRELLPRCRDFLESNDDQIQFWAAWAATVLGDKTAAGTLTTMATAGGPFAERACITAARVMAPGQALRWQQDLADLDHHRRLAVMAAGACGDPQSIPWLIEVMSENELARVAGESFTLITGMDLAFHDLDRDQPEEFEAGPTEDPADEDVSLDADEDLAWPDPSLLFPWWESNRQQFKTGRRYLAGNPIADKHLQVVLRKGWQRQRAVAALELVLANPGQPLFEVRARGDRQISLLEN